MSRIESYAVNSPTIFEEMATLSGLTTSNTIIRLSPGQIHGLRDSIGCMTSGAISAFIDKYPNISGDCYVALTSDNEGASVLVLDLVRPDKEGTVFDQDLVYIFNVGNKPLGLGDAKKLSHFDSEGRTFDASAYSGLSAYLDNRRDVPIPFAAISAVDPGIIKTISRGLDFCQKQRGLGCDD